MSLIVTNIITVGQVYRDNDARELRENGAFRTVTVDGPPEGKRGERRVPVTSSKGKRTYISEKRLLSKAYTLQ